MSKSHVPACPLLRTSRNTKAHRTVSCLDWTALHTSIQFSVPAIARSALPALARPQADAQQLTAFAEGLQHRVDALKGSVDVLALLGASQHHLRSATRRQAYFYGHTPLSPTRG